MTPASASAPSSPSSLNSKPTCWSEPQAASTSSASTLTTNDGFVPPCAIDYETCVAIGHRTDNLVHVVAADYGNQRDLFSLDQPIAHHPDQRWSDYIRGVVKCLQKGAAIQLRGLNMVVSGNVPQGPGSSSASLEVAVGQAFKEAQGLTSARPRSPSTANRRRTSSSAATAASWIR